MYGRLTISTAFVFAVLVALAPARAQEAGKAATSESSRAATNKKTVLEFFEKGLNQKDFEAVVPLFGSRYTQHNPNAADGVEGFRRFIGFLKEKFPQSHSEVKQVFADGDFVILHSHATRVPGTRGAAIVDIFKLENGKIVEHWDVVQEIPETTASGNSMF